MCGHGFLLCILLPILCSFAGLTDRDELHGFQYRITEPQCGDFVQSLIGNGMQRASFGFTDSSSTRFKIKLSLIYMREQTVDCASTPEDKGARVQVSEPNYCLLATNIEFFHGKLKQSRGRCRYYPN